MKRGGWFLCAFRNLHLEGVALINTYRVLSSYHFNLLSSLMLEVRTRTPTQGTELGFGESRPREFSET
jgi:hypothetical protein